MAWALFGSTLFMWLVTACAMLYAYKKMKLNLSILVLASYLDRKQAHNRGQLLVAHLKENLPRRKRKLTSLIAKLTGEIQENARETALKDLVVVYEHLKEVIPITPCRKCSCDLSEVASGICPECGEKVEGSPSR